MKHLLLLLLLLLLRLLLLLLLLLQSALQPLRVMACSTIVKYSQQEGFYWVPLPAARQTPNLEDQWFRTFQLPPQGVPSVWNDESEPEERKVESWAKNCREFCRKWRLPRHVNLRHGTDGFTFPPKEGGVRIFSPEKIRRLRPGVNPRTRVSKASTLTSRPPKPPIEFPVICISSYTTSLVEVKTCTGLVINKNYLL